MSRHSASNGGNGGNNNSGSFDDITLKLQDDGVLRVDLDRVNAADTTWGDRFIVGFDGVQVIDGIVFQRDDDPETWKVFGAGKFGALNPDDGLVYETDSYNEQLSAQEILDRPKVRGFFEEFGGDEYNYTPVGVVIEAGGDIAVNDDLPVDYDADDVAINVGEASMLLSNSTWVRTLAKKITSRGEGVINDNGDAPTSRGEEHTNPKYKDHGWLTTENPDLRTELEGRTVELWYGDTTEEINGEEVTYSQPNVVDVKTSNPAEDQFNHITIENGISQPDDDGDDDTSSGGQTNHEAGQQKADEAEADDAPAADPEPSEPEDEQEAEPAAADGGAAAVEVPAELEDIVGYFGRHGGCTADEFREFAEDEVDDASDIDWEGLAAEATRRAEA